MTVTGKGRTFERLNNNNSSSNNNCNNNNNNVGVKK